MFFRKKSNAEDLLKKSLETTERLANRVAVENDNLKGAIRNIRKALSATDHVDAEVALSIVDAATCHLVPRQLSQETANALEEMLQDAAAHGDIDRFREIKVILRG